MTTIAVTGASGHLGGLIVRSLIARGTEPASIVAIVRDQAKAGPLVEQGVSVRIAGYSDAEAVRRALEEVEKVVLVSGSEIGRRIEQHATVIDAARDAGVSLLAYTSVLGGDTTANPVRAEHVATEKHLIESGLPYVLLRDGWYNENYVATARDAARTGVLLGSVHDGKVSSAARSDFAEAAAAVLTGDGHENQTYELAGDLAWTQEDLAAAISKVTGTPVEYQDLTGEEHRERLIASGVGDGLADYLVGLDDATAAGALFSDSPALRELIGHPTVTLEETLRAELAD